MSLRERLARLLAPRVFEERERYGTVVTKLRDASYACGYEFPSVRVLADFVLGTTIAQPTATISMPEFISWLAASQEDSPDLAVRLKRTLEEQDERRT